MRWVWRLDFVGREEIELSGWASCAFTGCLLIRLDLVKKKLDVIKSFVGVLVVLALVLGQTVNE